MDLKIRNKTNAKTGNYLIRYIVIICLVILLAFYTIHFELFNRYLMNMNTEPVLQHYYWILLTKFISYFVNIFINFCILYAVTAKLNYSLIMVYVSFAILFTGALIELIKMTTSLPISLNTISFFVKINKSFVLLVIFLAGYLVTMEKRT